METNSSKNLNGGTPKQTPKADSEKKVDETITIDFTRKELSVILKTLLISKHYFEDNTRDEEQAGIENNLIDILREDYKIHSYNNSI